MSKSIQDHLFELVKSLSKSEKRYFKLYSSRHSTGNTNNYIVLFDYLDKKENYDEIEIFKHFKKEAFLNNFSITKKRLYDQILSALDAFHMTNSIDAQLYKMLHGIDILYNKSLYSHAVRLLNSAYKLAQKRERFTILLELEQKQQKMLETRHYSSIKKEELQELEQNSNAVLKQLKLQAELWFTKSYLFVDLNKKEANQLKEHHLHLNTIVEQEELSTSNTYLFNHIEAAYYFAVDDYKNSWKHLSNNIDLLEKSTFLIEEFPNYYFGTLTNAIYVNEKIGDSEKANRLLDTLKRFPRKFDLELSEDLLLKMFINTSSIELSLLTSRGEFSKALQSISYIENGMALYEDKIPLQKRVFFASKFAGIYMALGDFPKALKWINEILNTTNLESNENILAYTHILNLFVHLELKNNHLLPYTIKNTHRFLKTRNRLHSFEQIILQFISNFKKYLEIDRQEAWEKLFNELDALKNTSDYQLMIDYFDFETWVLSKIKKQPFYELVAQVNKQL